MKKYFIGIILIGLVACKQEAPQKINTYGSSISVVEGKTILNNLYYQNIGDGKVLAINKIENIDDSLQLPINIISPVLPKLDSAKWQIDFTAQNFEISKNYLVSESYLEGQDYTYSMFNLDNGKKIMDYTYDKYEILFTDNNEKRHFALYSKNAINRAKSDLKFNNKTLGYFLYTNADGIISQLALELKDADLQDKYDISNTHIELNSPEKNGVLLYNSNKSLFFTSISGENKEEINFEIDLTIFSFDPYEPHSLKLTVENDVLKFNEADLKATDFVLVSN